MRMVPIKSTFQKMVRLVRELAKNSGKEVGLKMKGEDTEIDRNMVDELYEPMVHMIRNSVDHGIEYPDEREKAGKDRRGIISLHAYHRGGNIVIEIEDDGKIILKIVNRVGEISGLTKVYRDVRKIPNLLDRKGIEHILQLMKIYRTVGRV